MARALMTIGLLIVAVAVLGLIVSDTEMGGDHETILRQAILAGAAFFGGGLACAMVSRLSKMRLRRGCPRCGRRVRAGHVYCEDHFQESVFRARDNQV